MPLIDVQKISSGETLSGGSVVVGGLNDDPVTSPGIVFSDETFTAESAIQTPITLDFDGIPVDPETGDRISIYSDGSYSFQLLTDQGSPFFQEPQRIIAPATAFTGLSDTFQYAGNALKVAIVNAAETALEVTTTLVGFVINGVTLLSSGGGGNFLADDGTYKPASGAGDVVGIGSASANDIIASNGSINDIKASGLTVSDINDVISESAATTIIAQNNATNIAGKEDKVVNTIQVTATDLTWSIPVGVVELKITAVGAGASGGGICNAMSVESLGGGGGAGGDAVIVSNVDVSGISTLGITIGAGGAAPSNVTDNVGNSGAAGGSTIVTVGTDTITAQGGDGGGNGGASGTSFPQGEGGDPQNGTQSSVSGSARVGVNEIFKGGYGHNSAAVYGSATASDGKSAEGGHPGQSGLPFAFTTGGQDRHSYGEGAKGGDAHLTPDTSPFAAEVGKQGIVVIEYRTQT